MIPLRDTQPRYSTPYITILLIAINAVVFLFELSLDPFSRNHFVHAYAIVPAHLHLSALVTSMFLHGGWMHIIGNMWFLWIFGDNVEDILGHFNYLIFYLACGVAAGLLFVAMSSGSHVPTIGASGAIAGVMGAYMVKFPGSRITTLIFIFVFFTTVDVPAVFMLLYWFVLQIYGGLGTIAESNLSQGGIAWFAHVGGFLAGMLLIFILPTRARYGRRRDLMW
jgi:membrane associated rhomboid family serine protease